MRETFDRNMSVIDAAVNEFDGSTEKNRTMPSRRHLNGANNGALLKEFSDL